MVRADFFVGLLSDTAFASLTSRFHQLRGIHAVATEADATELIEAYLDAELQPNRFDQLLAK